ncbi:MAG: efflux RND transporter periplasmic adaptor subunit [Acidobacteriota bacterium]|nr:efflux RND transporter periplasmic adaptor subunit [Acidobacteriota bacterium]
MIEDLSAMDKAVERPGGLSRRTMLAIAGGVAILVLAAFAVPTVRRWSRADRSIDASRVRIGEVTRGDLVRDASAEGKIVAALHPTLFAPTGGIVALLVRAGANVTKSQPLARIESPEVKSRLLQERATLQGLQSSFERGKIDARQDAIKNGHAIDLLDVRVTAARRLLERAQSAFDQGILNKTDYEKAKDDVRIAELELANAQATAKLQIETADFDIQSRKLLVDRQASVAGELQRQVDQLTLTAPFDGIVASVAVQDRDAVNANQPVVTVVNLSAFEVEITLPENYSSDVLPQTKAQILYEGREYPGHVTAMSPEVKDSQVRGTVVFEGDTPAGLRQSQRVSVRMVLEKKPNVLKLPRGPFLESGGGRQIYVVENGVATKRDIAVGAISVSEVEIRTGLREGEKVILSDTSELAGAKNVLIRN